MTSNRVAFRVACALAFVALSAAAAHAQPLSKLDPLLQPRVSSLTGSSRVIVQSTDAASLSAVTLLIQQLGGTVGRQLVLIDAVAARVPNTSLIPLASSALVQRIAYDRKVLGTNERTGATVGSTAVRQELGVDGTGIGIAVIDSGITGWHDDLTDPAAPGTQRVDDFVDFVNGENAPYDDYGHGTHVAGIIAGNGFDSNGARAGIAPGARLTVLKVLDGSGRGKISDVIAAIDYVVSHRNRSNIRIINLSVAAGVFESYNTDLLTLAARKAVERGLLVVAAAGNRGKDANRHIQYGAIGAPGNAPWVLTVGASSHMGTVDRSDDLVAAFSSRGPTAFDRAAKPDVVAPGVGIESLSAPGSTLYSSRSDYLLNGTVDPGYKPYLSLSGTSQAAPVVTGTAALMLQVNPALTPNAIKAILQYTAQEYSGYNALTQGAGFLNARGAVELAAYLAGLSSPYPSDTDWSRQIIWGNLRYRGGVLDASGNAWSTSVVWGDPATRNGDAVDWGVLCSTTECRRWTADTSWADTCVGAGCGGTATNNVVWGSACGGADCQGTAWRVPYAYAASGDTGETVVWGTTAADGETVVWGTSTSDSETVVWGTSDEEDIVWPACIGTSCGTGSVCG